MGFAGYPVALNNAALPWINIRPDIGYPASEERFTAEQGRISGTISICQLSESCGGCIMVLPDPKYYKKCSD